MHFFLNIFDLQLTESMDARSQVEMEVFLDSGRKLEDTAGICYLAEVAVTSHPTGSRPESAIQCLQNFAL